MNKLNFALGFYVVAAVTLLACNDGDTVVNTPQAPDTPPTVFNAMLTIRDARTHLPLDGAQASVPGGPGRTSGADGIVRLDSLEEGESLIKVSRADYATLTETVEISGEGSKSASKTVTRVVDLHKTGVTLKGRLYLRPLDGKTDLKPVNGATLELRVEGTFENPYRTAKTTASGEYSFSDLPEEAIYTLYPGFVTREGARYSADPIHYDGTGTEAGGEVVVGQLILQAAMDASPVMLSPLALEVRPEDSMELRFSEAIDTAKLVPGSIWATLGVSDEFFVGRAFAVETRWSADAKSVVLRPFQSQWPKNEPVSIRLIGFTGLSGAPLTGPAGGMVLSVSVSAVGDGELEPVDSLWVAPRFSFNTTSLVETADLDNIAQSYSLAWTKAAGATQYEVYSRENTEETWSLIQVSPGTEFTYNSPAPSGYITLRRQHMVIPRNWSRRGRFGDAMVLTLKDNVRPVISGVGQNSWQNFFYSSLSKLGNESLDNTFGTSDKAIDFILTLRGPQGNVLEPLDTARTPSVRYLEQEGVVEGAVHQDFRWITPTTARLRLRLEPGANAYGASMEINFQIIQDLAGNPVAPVNGMTTANFYLGF